ncbi:MAG: cold shock domain-containing protein [Bacteroidales bacterium]|nr:cold shock domain-containing protein [Bacteroidales bacterium]
MGRSQETYKKKEVRSKKEKKRKDKEKRRLERKENEKNNSLENMIAYVDENGNITSTPPDLGKKKDIKAEDIEIGVPKKVESEEDKIRNGIVKYFNHDKGYGFIKDSVSHESIFVHANNLLEEISENDKVNYEIEKGPKGMIAVGVSLIK